MAEEQTKTRLALLRELMAKKQAARKKMLDERGYDVEEYAESEQERFDRIMDDKSAWR